MERKKEPELPYNYQFVDIPHEDYCEFSVFVHARCLSTLIIDKPKENLKFHSEVGSGHISYLNDADDGCIISWINKELKQVKFCVQFGGNVCEFMGAYNDSFVHSLDLWHRSVFGKKFEPPQ